MENPTSIKNVDEYIASFPEAVQEILQKIRAIIREAVPEAGETIKYQIPTYTLNGNLISFAAYKKHIGLYPVPAGTEEFQREISKFRAEKSTLRLPLDKPIPYGLIAQMVMFRQAEHQERPQAKQRQKR